MSEIIEETPVNSSMTALEEKLRRDASAFCKALQSTMDIENELDQEYVQETEGDGRRRKHRLDENFEFKGISSRTALEDLREIYDGMKVDETFGSMSLKKNDTVQCVVDKKKYRGTIVSINQKGIVVKTKDKRKIRISWEDIQDEEAQVTKIHFED